MNEPQVPQEQEKKKQKEAGTKPGPKIALAVVGFLFSLLALSYDRDDSGGWVFRAAHIEMPEILLAAVVVLLVLLLTNSYEILSYMRGVGEITAQAKEAATAARDLIGRVNVQTANIVAGHDRQKQYPKEHYARVIARHVLKRLTDKGTFQFGTNKISLDGEDLAYQAYLNLFKHVLKGLNESRKIMVHAIHATSFHIWNTTRGGEFMAVQAAIAQMQNAEITRLVVGPVPFEALSEHATEYYEVMRRMIDDGITLYYMDRSSAAVPDINDSVLVEDGNTCLGYRWLPNNDGHSIRGAEITWDTGEAQRLRKLWDTEIAVRIKSGVIVKLVPDADSKVVRA